MSLPPFMRPLGETGLTVSAIGLGTVKIGRNQGVKYPSGFELPDDQQVRNLLACARELGINLIDTAPAYGRSEERLGQLLTQRDEWIIVSKVGEEFEHGQSHFDFSPAHLRRSLERSLRRLGTDYLDVLLVHSDGEDDDIIAGGALETLADFKREGLVRATGMSTKTVSGGLAALARSDMAMVTYNLAERDERAVIDAAQDAGRGILVKKAFASGHACVSDGDAVQHSLDLVLGHPGTSAVIAGTINLDHLRENVDKAHRALTGSNTND